MPVGPVSGETVDNLLISSVAANTQAHETAATFDELSKLSPFLALMRLLFVDLNVFLC